MWLFAACVACRCVQVVQAVAELMLWALGCGMLCWGHQMSMGLHRSLGTCQRATASSRHVLGVAV